MKKIIGQLKPYVPEEPAESVKARLGVERLVRLSANENPYGTSPKVREAVLDYVTNNDANLYPDGNASSLRSVLADYWKVAENQAVDTTTRLVWICNPNNPTGTYETVEDIRNFISTLSKDVLVIIDEAYIDFVTSVEVPTARALLDEFPNVFIMRTFSKAYGLANYRVGYMMSSAELANYIQTIRLPYNLNTLSQVAAEAAFGDREFLRSTIEKNAAERALWEQTLDEVGGTYYKSGANFIFMSVPNADGLADEWLAKGYQVRRGQRDNWLRVTLPPASDGTIMRAILKEYMARQ